MSNPDPAAGRGGGLLQRFMALWGVGGPSAQRAIVRHPESWVGFDEFDRVPLPYRPTYAEFGDLIDASHRALADAPVKGPLIDIGVPGWLRVEDALKLYELAYFCRENILELGTNRGLSTSIMASAVLSSANDVGITTIELDPQLSAAARRNLEDRALDRPVTFVAAEASAALDGMMASKQRFGLSFVDHSHTYEAVAQACRSLRLLIAPGGFVVFHDFVDRRNTRRRNVGDAGDEYGVYAAVQDALPAMEFEFCGCYGCCGVFRRLP